MAASLALQWSQKIFSRVYNLDFVGVFWFVWVFLVGWLVFIFFFLFSFITWHSLKYHLSSLFLNKTELRTLRSAVPAWALNQTPETVSWAFQEFLHSFCLQKGPSCNKQGRALVWRLKSRHSQWMLDICLFHNDFFYYKTEWGEHCDRATLFHPAMLGCKCCWKHREGAVDLGY